MNVCAEHSFAEAEGDNGVAVLLPCHVCGFRPADAIVALNKALDCARAALTDASKLTWEVSRMNKIVSGGLYEVSKIIRSMEVVIE